MKRGVGRGRSIFEREGGEALLEDEGSREASLVEWLVMVPGGGTVKRAVSHSGSAG